MTNTLTQFTITEASDRYALAVTAFERTETEGVYLLEQWQS